MLTQQTRISNDFGVLLKNLLSTMIAYANFLEKENSILSKREIKKAALLVEKKEAYLEELQKMEETIHKAYSAEGIEQNSDTVAKIKKIYSNLQSLLYQNEILLKSSLAVNDKIMEIYKTRKKEETAQQFGYDKQGGMAAHKKLEKVMPAISLNSKF